MFPRFQMRLADHFESVRPRILRQPPEITQTSIAVDNDCISFSFHVGTSYFHSKSLTTQFLGISI